MLRSQKCVLHGKTDVELADLGECTFVKDVYEWLVPMIKLGMGLTFV